MGDHHPIAESLTALAEILKREKARGVDTLGLLPETEENLRGMPMAIMKAAVSAAALNTGRVDSSPPAKQGSAPVKGNEGGRSEKEIRASLNAIFKEAKACPECLKLGTLGDTIVFAAGNPMADLMFVGEAPGSEEEKERKPLAGASRQKLDQIIQAMGLNPSDVYFSNIVKFRPKKGDGRFQGASDRKPDATEMSASIKYIRAEIETIRPKAIVVLGATAAEGLLEIGGTFSSLRQSTHQFDGVPVIVTYHPSFLLRQEGEGDPEKAKAAKRSIWEDMLRAMELLDMTVSEKQRGFFL